MNGTGCKTFLFFRGLILTAAIIMLTIPAQAGEQSFRSIMQGLAKDMGRIQTAMFMEDFATIAEAAEAVADHPRPSDRERQRVMSALGAEVDAFRALDRQVHDGAESLAKAARANDMDAVVLYHAQTARACIACHTAFRDQLTE